MYFILGIVTIFIFMIASVLALVLFVLYEGDDFVDDLLLCISMICFVTAVFGMMTALGTNIDDLLYPLRILIGFWIAYVLYTIALYIKNKYADRAE